MKRLTPATIKPLQSLKVISAGARLRIGHAASLSLLAGAMVFCPAATRAITNGTWTLNNNGTWSNGANWSGGSVADGPASTASFSTINISADRTVTLDAPRTVGSIQFGDTGGAQNWILSGANTLTMDNGANKPLLRALQNAATISVILGGVNGFRSPDQSATIVLNNAANTFTGDVEVYRGTLKIGAAGSLPSGGRTGNVNFINNGSGNGTLDLNAKTMTINGLASISPGLGTVTSSAAGSITLTVGDNNANADFAGVIQNGSGTVGLTKTGSGTQSLSGANTYTGVTTVNGGSLLIVGSVNSGTTTVIAGTLVLMGTLNSTVITVNGGSLQVTNSGTLPNAATISLSGTGTLDVSGASVQPFSITSSQTLTGTGGTGTILGGLTLDSGASLGLTYAPGVPAMNVATNTLTLNGNATIVNVTGGSPLLDGTYKLISKSGTGLVAGTPGSVAFAGLGMAGGGTASLSISGDELYLTITNGSAGLEWGSGNGTWADAVTGWNSGGATAFTNGNVALLTDKYSTGNPTLTLNTEVLPQSVVASSTNSYTITGTGDMSGSASLSKLNTGALTLDTTNNFTGGVTLWLGTLNLKKASALGDVSSTFTINGGTLDNTSGGPLTNLDYPVTWNSNFVFTGTGDLNLGVGNVTLTGNRTVTVNAGTLTVGGAISGTGFGPTKAGAGTLRLGGNNAFTGTMTINLGDVIVDNDGALNSGSPVTVSFLNDANAKSLTLNGHSISVKGLVMGATTAGAVVRNNDPSTPVALTINSTVDSQYGATISDGGAASLALTKLGAGVFTLGSGGQGSGTYSGDTTVTQGTLRAGATDVFPHGAGKGNTFVNSGATFDTGDRGQITINALSGGGLVTHFANSGGNIFRVGESGASGDFGGVIQNGASISPFVSLVKLGSGTQTLSGANTYTSGTTISGGVLQIGNGGSSGSLASVGITNNSILVFNRDGTMTYSGVISGTGPVTNMGPGIVNLTGNNTYTNTTTVIGGTLRVNGAGRLAAGAGVLVNANGTFGGTGTVLCSVSVADGGTLAPGASIGTLTISNNLALSAASTNVFELDLNSSACDKVAGLSNVTYNGTLVLVNTNLDGSSSAATNGASFKLFTAQIYSGSFVSSNLPPLAPNLAWDLSTLSNGLVRILYTGATNAPTITNQLSADMLTLTWPADHTGWRLQSQTNTTDIGLSTNWFPVPGSSTNDQITFQVDPANGAVFYRLVNP